MCRFLVHISSLSSRTCPVHCWSSQYVVVKPSFPCNSDSQQLVTVNGNTDHISYRLTLFSRRSRQPTGLHAHPPPSYFHSTIGTGSPGQRLWPGRVGSRVKGSDPVPSLFHRVDTASLLGLSLTLYTHFFAKKLLNSLLNRPIPEFEIIHTLGCHALSLLLPTAVIPKISTLILTRL